MSFYYINFAPQNERYISSNNKYIVVSKLDKPNKKTSKENYKADLERYENQQKMLELLKSNHYNCYNQPFTAYDIIADIIHIFENPDQYLVFKIKPTSSRTDYSGYKSKLLIWEFDVLKRFYNVEDLIKDMAEEYILNDVWAKLIVDKSYKNTIDDFKSLAKKLSELDTEHKEYRILHEIAQYLNGSGWTEGVDDNFIHAIENGYIIPWYKSYEYEKCIVRLIENKLYKTALKYTEEAIKNEADTKVSQGTSNLLRNNMDKAEVEKIVELIQASFPDMKLEVIKTTYEEYGSDTVEVVETVFLPNMNEVKSYIIKKYDVSFQDAMKDVDKIEKRIGDRDYTECYYNFKVS